MVTIEGQGSRFCDGVTRRSFLKIGTSVIGGLSMTDLFAAEARAGRKPGHKAVIVVYLPGGPPHQDTWDLKMDAPAELRGEFKPIDTNVPGIQICELFPRIARMMDRFAVVRSLVGARDEHANPLCISGYPLAEQNKNHPCLGSAIAKAFGPVEKTIPPFVDLIQKTQHKPYSYAQSTGWLGRSYSAARTDADSMADMTLKGITLERLHDRQRLLAAVDGFRRTVDSGMLEAQDVATRQAFNVLTSKRFVEALDVSREDPKLLARFGKGQDAPAGDGCSLRNEQFLVARKLVEAGVRCVTLGYGFWDFHGANFQNMRRYAPMLDQAVSALVEDLHERGLEQDVSVVVWGDFGRTPKINKEAGRDHWPSVSSCLLAGGGMRTGQVIGSTTRDGGYADDRPVHHRDVMATLLHNLGFDVRTQQVADEFERPQSLYPEHEPVQELIG